MHWSRTEKREETIEKIRTAQIGARNSQWNDTNPSYGSVHSWLRNNYVHLKKKCQKCGGKRFLEWALRKGEKHLHSVENYLILCSSCHKKYDYTDERRAKLSKTLTGRKHWWAYKIAKANIGNKQSEEAKRKISVFQKANPKKRNEKGQFTRK